MAEPVNAPVPIADPGDPDLQGQIDGLRIALRDWRRTREYSQPTQERLEQITLQCARLVEAWQQTERRRSSSVARIDERRDPGAVESRLQRATGERIHALERAIEQEWEALPKGTDDPARQLTEQAASLAESCVAAANLALRGFANAESRVATLERDIQSGMAQLSRDLQSILAELRSARPPGLPGSNPAFPLEGVMRIHQELRESDAHAPPAQKAIEANPADAPPKEAESTTALVARVESLERAVEHAAEAPPAPRGGWLPWYAIAALIAALAGVAFFGLWMQRRVDARLNEAALRVSAAEQQRDASMAATREDASRQVADARQSAAQAQIVGNVLAAPDLVRYWLAGAGSTSRAYAQVLFSRSRGVVFSALRLDPAPAGKSYQLWLLTRGGPVSAGVVTPDADGSVTLATGVPVTVPGRLTGAVVTLEAAGGGTEPSGDTVLVRVE